MPTYRITVDGTTFMVEVPDQLKPPATVIVDGQPVIVDWQRLSAVAEGALNRPVKPPAAPNVLPPAAAGEAPAPPGAPTLANAIIAPMPGKVLAVKVAPGDQVAYGQELLVLEAMKMAQSIRSARAGTIATVHVAANDSVRQGQALVTFQ